MKAGSHKGNRKRPNDDTGEEQDLFMEAVKKISSQRKRVPSLPLLWSLGDTYKPAVEQVKPKKVAFDGYNLITPSRMQACFEDLGCNHSMNAKAAWSIPEGVFTGPYVRKPFSLRWAVSKETQALLPKAFSDKPTDPNLAQMLRTGSLQKCSLFQSKIDPECLTVIANEYIAKGEDVGIVCGEIMEQDVFDKWLEDDEEDIRHLWTYGIAPELIPGYQGPELVINSVVFGNETRFINDPTWKSARAQPNVQARLDFSTEFPVVVICATRPIHHGDELLINWGEKCVELLKKSNGGVVKRKFPSLLRFEEISWHDDVDRKEDSPSGASEDDNASSENLSNFVSTRKWIRPDAMAPVTAPFENPVDNKVSALIAQVNPNLRLVTPENMKNVFHQAGCQWSLQPEGIDAPLPFVIRFNPSVGQDTRESMPYLNSSLQAGRGIKTLAYGKLVGCGLYQDLTDLGNLTVFAHKKITKGTVIGAVNTEIFEESYLSGLLPDTEDIRHIWSYPLPHSYLKGYSGPDLVFSSLFYGNEARFINDPTWKRVTCDPNVQVILDYHNGTGLPVLILEALTSIDPGDELLMNWGQECLTQLQKIQLEKLACTNHMAHFLCGTLERKCHDLDINIPSRDLGSDKPSSTPMSSPKKTPGGGGSSVSPRKSLEGSCVPSLTMAKHWGPNFSTTPAPMDNSVDTTMATLSSLGKIKKKVNEVEEVFELTSNSFTQIVSLSTQNGDLGDSPSLLSPSALLINAALRKAVEMDSSKDHELKMSRGELDQSAYTILTKNQVKEVYKICKCTYGETLELHDGVMAELQKSNMPETKMPKKHRDIYELVAKRVHFSLCSIAKITSFFHPARWLTPPNQKAVYALLANRDIPAGTVLGFGAGTLRLDKDQREGVKQWYAFGINEEDSAAMKYKGEPLYFECAHYGNEIRFINDCFGIPGKRHNAHARVVWLKRSHSLPTIPYVFAEALETIYKGQEIFFDYGPTFWDDQTKQTILEHEQYYKLIVERLTRLKAALLAHGVTELDIEALCNIPLPDHFDSDIVEY